MKKRLLIGRIIGFVGICLFAMGISYVFTYYLEKSLYASVNLLVTFEDTLKFQLENTNKLEKEETLNTYPYIFKIENKGEEKVNYQIKIEDVESNVLRSDLNYILYLNEKEIGEGSLDSLKEDILYTDKIGKGDTSTYKLYIYLKTEKNDANYQYSLQVVSF